MSAVSNTTLLGNDTLLVPLCHLIPSLIVLVLCQKPLIDDYNLTDVHQVSNSSLVDGEWSVDDLVQHVGACNDSIANCSSWSINTLDVGWLPDVATETNTTTTWTLQEDVRTQSIHKFHLIKAIVLISVVVVILMSTCKILLQVFVTYSSDSHDK